jgi:hypothetical protein
MSDARSPDVAAVRHVDRAQPRWFLLLDHSRDLMNRKLVELIRQPLCQELKQNDAQGVHIRAAVEPGWVGGNLFRAHVAQGAEQLAGLGSARRRQKVGGRHTGNAEVEHLEPAGLIDQDVAWLEIAMNDPFVVGILHRIAHSCQQFEASLCAETPSAREFVQGHAADELHGEERLAIFTDPGFVDLSDSGMLEPRQDLCFVVEALDELG